MRTLFRLHEELGCLRRVEVAAAEQGPPSKARTFADGRTSGGGPSSRGQSHYLLTKVTYRGLIRHKHQSFPGQRPAIVEEALWNRVQAKLQAAAVRPRRGLARSGCMRNIGRQPHDPHGLGSADAADPAVGMGTDPLVPSSAAPSWADPSLAADPAGVLAGLSRRLQASSATRRATGPRPPSPSRRGGGSATASPGGSCCGRRRGPSRRIGPAR